MSQLNPLAQSVATQKAVAQLRLANYFTPYGFNPEQVDFDRAGSLLESATARDAFASASPNLLNRVDTVVNDWEQANEQLDALANAGATIDMDNVTAYTQARAQLFDRASVAA